MKARLKSPPVTSATAKAFEFTGLDKLTHPIDQFVQIGQLKLSRLILGGGMISGYAHPRDLKYLSGPNGLMKAYNTPRRIYDTMHLAEACGVDTIPTDTDSVPLKAFSLSGDPAIAKLFSQFSFGVHDPEARGPVRVRVPVQCVSHSPCSTRTAGEKSYLPISGDSPFRDPRHCFVNPCLEVGHRYFIQRSSQPKNSLCQRRAFCGCRIQWHSSGKITSLLGTPIICAAANAAIPWV